MASVCEFQENCYLILKAVINSKLSGSFRPSQKYTKRKQNCITNLVIWSSPRAKLKFPDPDISSMPGNKNLYSLKSRECVLSENKKFYLKQECIPVGCVPPSRGGCLLGRGVPPSGGGVLLGGGCRLPGGLLGRGCLLLGGVSLAGGVPPSGGLLALGSPWWGGIPACTEADPPVNRMTDRCKNITLATTSLRPVTISCQGMVSAVKPLPLKGAL